MAKRRVKLLCLVGGVRLVMRVAGLGLRMFLCESLPHLYSLFPRLVTRCSLSTRVVLSQ
jgi:hypothetical protein